MKIAWVIGSGGLLGAALCGALRRQGIALFFPAGRFVWNDGAMLRTQMVTAMRAFVSQANSADGWQLYWAAGVGAMSSSEDVLASETQALTVLLHLLEAALPVLTAPGAIAFSSSAGAIYAGSSDTVNTENTAPAPTTAYAREKLKQEDLLDAFTCACTNITVLIARLSTIYGPGQASGKQQGLLSHMARRILRHQPIQIYVPFDTIRDYIDVDDAAASMVNVLSCEALQKGIHTKIIASERPTTIAEIISVFRRIAHRQPLIITSANQMSSLYSRRVQFRSIVLPEATRPAATSLTVGIARLMMTERNTFANKAPSCPTVGG